MNKEMELQVIGRGQRIGRKKLLKVIYLINNGTESEINHFDSTENSDPMIRIKKEKDLNILND
jgi:hypothetical protein